MVPSICLGHTGTETQIVASGGGGGCALNDEQREIIDRQYSVDSVAFSTGLKVRPHRNASHDGSELRILRYYMTNLPKGKDIGNLKISAKQFLLIARNLGIGYVNVYARKGTGAFPLFFGRTGEDVWANYEVLNEEECNEQVSLSAFAPCKDIRDLVSSMINVSVVSEINALKLKMEQMEKRQDQADKKIQASYQLLKGLMEGKS